MTIEFISRHDVNVGDVVRDRRKRKWIVINIEPHNGSHNQLVHLVRLGATGPLTYVKWLDDEQFEKFQAKPDASVRGAE